MISSRFFLLAWLGISFLLNLTQFAINEELRWRFEQIVSVVDRDPQDIPKPDSAEFKVIGLYGPNARSDTRNFQNRWTRFIVRADLKECE